MPEVPAEYLHAFYGRKFACFWAYFCQIEYIFAKTRREKFRKIPNPYPCNHRGKLIGGTALLPEEGIFDCNCFLSHSLFSFSWGIGGLLFTRHFVANPKTRELLMGE